MREARPRRDGRALRWAGARTTRRRRHAAPRRRWWCPGRPQRASSGRSAPWASGRRRSPSWARTSSTCPTGSRAAAATPGPRRGHLRGAGGTVGLERFLVDIGDGEAVVSVSAKQDHDRAGWLINGDFQSTNGTSSVADPDDRDVPARLRAAVDYVRDGLITTLTPADDGSGDPAPLAAVRVEMGDLFVCDATLEHTAANDAAFKQDDTPNDFHGAFVSFVARGGDDGGRVGVPDRRARRVHVVRLHGVRALAAGGPLPPGRGRRGGGGRAPRPVRRRHEGRPAGAAGELHQRA